MNHIKTPDIKIKNLEWEIKTPSTDKMSGIEQILKRASKQSSNIIISSIKIKNLRDTEIEKFLYKKVQSQRSIKRLKFVNKRGKIIDIL